MKHDGYVVKLRDNKPGRAYEILEKMRQSHGLLGFTQSLLGEKTGLFIFHPKNEKEVERLMDDSRVEFCEPNMILSLDPNEMVSAAELSDEPAREWAPNDPLYEKQWHLRMIDMEKAWNKSTGKGAIVAVLDTGVAYDGTRDGKYLRSSDMNPRQQMKPYDMITGTKTAYDGYGHGTHCAGTIGEWTNNKQGAAGIAYDCKIIPVKVLSDRGSGSIAGIADGIHYAVDNGAHIISMSLGGPGTSKVLESACQYAYDHDVLTVVAAGNEGNDRKGYPAGYSTCLTVSAVGPNTELASYSSYGDYLNIAAPGGDIRRSGREEDGVLQCTIYGHKDGYAWFQGTSMATPHVAGTAALLVGRGIKGREKLWKALTETAIDKGDAYHYGAGIVNAWNALNW